MRVPLEKHFVDESHFADQEFVAPLLVLHQVDLGNELTLVHIARIVLVDVLRHGEGVFLGKENSQALLASL